jgi:hypothetical protein
MEPQAVGQQLGVQAVLTGRVVHRGDVLTISAELLSIPDGSHMWGEQYNRKMTDVLSLQQEIARNVSQKLRARLSGAEEQRVAKSYTENADAYQLYLKGRYYWFKISGERIREESRLFSAGDRCRSKLCTCLCRIGGILRLWSCKRFLATDPRKLVKSRGSGGQSVRVRQYARRRS